MFLISRRVPPHAHPTSSILSFADVLQYLKAPEKTIERMKKYLKQDGSILASVTNVLNYKVIKDMINGSWNNENKDYLGNTQLRYFTRVSFESMFKEAGYGEVYITSLANMPENEEDERFVDNISELSSCSSIKDELLNYEYYIKAQKLPEYGSFELKNDINIIIKELDKDMNDDTLMDEIIRIIKFEGITPSQLTAYIEDKVFHEEQMLNALADRCLKSNLEDYSQALFEKMNGKDIIENYED